MLPYISKDRFLEFVAYSIIIAAFIISIVFPVVIQFTEPFAAPTAVHSKTIMNTGHLAQGGFLPYPQVFWGNAINSQIQYPLASILVSVFMLISGIPFQYAMFIPLSAIGNIIYVVLAKYIFDRITINKGVAWFFSALFYLYFVVSISANGTIGYASLGITFLAFLIYIYLRFSYESKIPVFNSNHFGLMVILIILVVAIGFLYYFATIDVIALMALLIIATPLAKNSLPRKRPWLECSILIIALFLFLGKALMVEQIQNATITQMFSNFWQYIGSMVGRFGIKLDWLNTESTLWNMNLVHYDPITSLGSRMLLITQYSSLFVVLACLFAYRPQKVQSISKYVVWLFCIFILFSSFGELGYLTIGPKSPLRLLLWFGPIVTLSIAIGFLNKKNRIIKLRNKLNIVGVILVIFLFCAGTWGGLHVAATYGLASAKPLAYDHIYPLSSFICTYANSVRPFVFTCDENYAANVFFITSIYNKTHSIVAEPLLGDAIALNNAIVSGDPQLFLSEISDRNINYLLIVDDGKPIYGDVWGYIINGQNVDTISKLQFTLIYTDGRVHLFELFPSY